MRARKNVSSGAEGIVHARQYSRDWVASGEPLGVCTSIPVRPIRHRLSAGRLVLTRRGRFSSSAILLLETFGVALLDAIAYRNVSLDEWDDYNNLAPLPSVPPPSQHPTSLR